MTKVFFSHATEDKQVVRQIMRVLVETYPEVSAWIDEFEIVSGTSLLAKISEGMDEADKFFIFLSPTSITKPWVLAELRDALTLDIQGVKPDFVIPVIVEGLDALPPFLRDKKHVDITKLTKDQWTSEMKAALEGKFENKAVADEPNLIVRRERDSVRPNVSTLVFSAQYWAERLAFQIVTTAQIFVHDTKWRMGGFGGGYTELLSGLQEVDGSKYYFNFARQGEMISPKEEFELRYRMAPGVDAFDAFEAFARWDGSGVQQSFHVLPIKFEGPEDSGRPRLPRVDDPD